MMRNSGRRRGREEIQTIHPNVVRDLPAGRLEVLDRTYAGQWTNILQPAYSSYVKGQLRLAVDIAGSGGARVILLTAPCYDTGEQPDGRPWPEDSPQRLTRYNQIVRSVAVESNESLVNFNALVCPHGRYQSHIDSYDARYDGVHFTLGGGVVFEPELFRSLKGSGERTWIRTETGGPHGCGRQNAAQRRGSASLVARVDSPPPRLRLHHPSSVRTISNSDLETDTLRM